MLKSGNDVDAKKYMEKESRNDAIDKSVKHISLDDQKTNLDKQIADFNVRKNKLDELERELKNKGEQLDADKVSFRAEISAEVRAELEKKYSSEHVTLNSRVLALIESLETAKRSELSTLDNEIYNVVFEAVCKIIGTSVTNSEVVVSIVREVMRHAQDRMQMVIRVAPADFEIIQEAKDTLSKGMSNRVDIVADDHINYGGCIVQTDAGSIDGRLEQQLSSLLDLILSQRSPGAAPN